jgi:hypothetical protein
VTDWFAAWLVRRVEEMSAAAALLLAIAGCAAMDSPAATKTPVTARNLAKNFVTTTRNTLLIRRHSEESGDILSTPKPVAPRSMEIVGTPRRLVSVTYAVSFGSGKRGIQIARQTGSEAR